MGCCGLVIKDDMLNLNELGVQLFIKRAKDISPFWDNYDLVIWKKDSSGFTNKSGMFRKNSWGISKRIRINNIGVWELPKQYVKYFR